MEQILIVVINLVLELFLNILAIFPWEVPLYKGEKEEGNSTILRCVYTFLIGLFIGCLSLMFFPKTLISISYLRIASLFISPFLAGLLSKKIAERVHLKKDNVWPERHFWYGFWLCLGYVFVRFIGVQH